MTQLPLDFDSDRTRRAQVWIWCALLMRTEATPLEYPEKPMAAEERERADEQIEALCDAGDRFMAKAGEVAGAPITDEQWDAAMQAFTTIE